jgi:hypothetical protein
MGSHRDEDNPADGGSGGGAGTDGSKRNEHGAEPFPTPSGDGQDPGQ